MAADQVACNGGIPRVHVRLWYVACAWFARLVLTELRTRRAPRVALPRLD